MNCPFCASGNVRRSRRRGIGEKLKCWTGKRPYRCHNCMHRFFSYKKYNRRTSPSSEIRACTQVIDIRDANLG